MKSASSVGSIVPAVSDSVTVVVSEETGKVSLAENGRLKEDIGKEELFEVLSSLYTMEETSRFKLRFRRRKKQRQIRKQKLSR